MSLTLPYPGLMVASGCHKVAPLLGQRPCHVSRRALINFSSSLHKKTRKGFCWKAPDWKQETGMPPPALPQTPCTALGKLHSPLMNPSSIKAQTVVIPHFLILACEQILSCLGSAQIGPGWQGKRQASIQLTYKNARQLDSRYQNRRAPALDGTRIPSPYRQLHPFGSPSRIPAPCGLWATACNELHTQETSSPSVTGLSWNAPL